MHFITYNSEYDEYCVGMFRVDQRFSFISFYKRVYTKPRDMYVNEKAYLPLFFLNGELT